MEKKDYFRLHQGLSCGNQNYFQVLSKTYESVLFEVATILRRPYFESEADLFDLQHFFRFSTRSRNGISMFNNFDSMVLDTLEASKDFERLVEAQMAAGINREVAIVDVFLVECFNAFLGAKWSPAGRYLTRFKEWMKNRAYMTLSKEEIRTQHRENVQGWTPGLPDRWESNAQANAVATLSGPCLRFIYDCCYSGRDRQLALLITKNLYDRLWAKSATEIKANLWVFYYDPTFTEADLHRRIDLIRRRLCAYLALEGVAGELPTDIRRFQDKEHYLNWLLDCAGVANLEQAKRLLTTSIICKNAPPENDDNYAQSVKDLTGLFTRLGYRCKTEGTTTSPILYVWPDETDYPSIQVFPPGVFYKDGQARPIKELL